MLLGGFEFLLFLFLFRFSDAGLVQNVLGIKDQECYEPYGCFTNQDFNGALPKIVQKIPLPPKAINLTYYYFNSENKKSPFVFGYDANQQKLESIPFTSDRSLRILVHGWLSTYTEDSWNGKLKNIILEQKPNANILVIDWKGGAKIPSYSLSVANTRLVGRILARTLRQLASIFGFTPSNVHCIGHSLGAQVCGFFGQEFTGPKIAKITGLDPAGPGFNHHKTSLRLDKTDAVFVQVLHTDAHTFVISEGTKLSVGHVDIWINGGHRQPNCTLLDATRSFGTIISSELQLFKSLAPNTNALYEASCSHNRAPIIYATAFKNQQYECRNVAYLCDSYEKFQKGLCNECGPNNERCLSLDYTETQNQQPSFFPANYFVETSGQEPWCVFQYAVIIETNEYSDDFKGKIEIVLEGEFDTLTVKFSDNFKPSSNHTTLAVNDKFLGYIRSAGAQLNIGPIKRATNFALRRSGHSLEVTRILIKPMSFLDSVMRSKFEVVLCPTDTVQSSYDTKFYPCYS